MLTVSEFKRLLDRLSIEVATLNKETLTNGAKKLRCSKCGAKTAKITKQTILEDAKADIRKKEARCKICQEAFIAPRAELRSKIGICPRCKREQDALSAKDKKGFSSLSSKVQPLGRYLDNLPPGGRSPEIGSKREKLVSSHDISEYEEGTPRPGWANNSDWKKMRGRQYSDMKKRQRDG
jgi:Zn finger protein HypA/HybF involved in hydrogenase expression